MRIGPSLLLASRQTLAMTPQLQQAIKLLQFSHLELAAYIQQELEKNPLLQEGPPEDGPTDEKEAGVAGPPVDTAETLAAAAPALAEADDRWAGEFVDRGGDGASGGGALRDDAPDALALVAGRPCSLATHVLGQIEPIFRDAGERRVALRLAESLDEAGYCQADAVVVAQALDVAVGTVERVWSRLRQIEPAGLFARTLAECLAAQLAERNRLDPAMQAFLDNLDLVAAGEFGQLRRRCGVDEEDLRDMLAEVRALDPRPGAAFDFEPMQPVMPDLSLVPARDPETGEEGWHIELNTEALPRVLVDRMYHATLMKGARGKADRDFIAERFQSASWLVKTLEQRATTILKVAREIVRQQDGFFRHGVSALRPLVLRDIAVATELHESTVSRVTSNKYIATPRGIFELKYFFTSALAAHAPGVMVSSEAVRSRIRRLVEGENATQPLSDDRIVDLLKREGVEIARRTVAKYRDAMRIPSSAERRRLGRLGIGRLSSASPTPDARAREIATGPAD
ncbi:RNA polymerase factor sigma-54 [Enhydrobacter sp.]|uniref:RNA polymerase factor sigma-54 n=1 Tax=Enhydrobacter sp. TaxID=1894999 RepID=UPI002610C72F|nr:RNA polymerase factor sigma-54 [Enhydrobacter sp.]WIM10874.1 MAG: RNA polymerase sigma-54 factor RpoN [Enhydrobacter sp.]